MKSSLVLLLLSMVIIIHAELDVFEQEGQFAEFAEHLADFSPQESFEFQLQAGEQHNLIFWPVPTEKILRGIFYITSEQNQGLFVGCESNQEIKKSFYDKKIGIFNIPYGGVGDMKLIFKAEISSVKIYLSYQLVGKKIQLNLNRIPSQNKGESEKNEKQETGMSKILSKFTKVDSSISTQQQILKSILKGSTLQMSRIEKQIENKKIKTLIETGIVLASGVISVWMLRKELKTGYDPII